MDKTLPSEIKNHLGKKPISVSWKRNKIIAKLKQFIPHGMNDYRIAFAAKHIVANIASEFLKCPPQLTTRHDFDLNVSNEKSLYSCYVSDGAYWQTANSNICKIIEHVQKNLKIDLDNTVISVCPCFNEDNTLNEDLTFWKLVDEVNSFLKTIDCSERVKTQVKSMFMEKCMLPEKERERIKKVYADESFF